MRWRFRGGSYSRELGTDYGSDDFARRYEDAALELAGGKKAGAGADKTVLGSVSDLVARWYQSPDFRNLAPLTQYGHRGIIEPFRAEHGDKLVQLLARRHVAAILAKKADTPAAAKNLRKRLNQILDFAVSLDWITANPARLTKSYKVGGDGFHTWSEDDISQFYRGHAPGTMAHRAVTVMLYTGTARVDAVALGPLNMRGTRLEYRRRKMEGRDGVLISIPLHPDLAALLADLPKDRPYLATAYGKGRSPNGLGDLVREWCNMAGLPECSAHGLRKACARRLAEAGATAHEIMAVTGHKPLAEVQRYTEAALREGLADSAVAKLLARPNREQTAVNLPERFTGKTGK